MLRRNYYIFAWTTAAGRPWPRPCEPWSSAPLRQRQNSRLFKNDADTCRNDGRFHGGSSYGVDCPLLNICGWRQMSLFRSVKPDLSTFNLQALSSIDAAWPPGLGTLT